MGNKFWSRYKDKKFYERGLGELWLTRNELNFRLYLTLDPIKIPTRAIHGISFSHGHAGKISSKLVLKIHWKMEDLDLVSGFSSIKNPNELLQWERLLRKVIKA